MTGANLQALLLASIAGALVFVGVRLGQLTEAVRQSAPRPGQLQTAQGHREAGEVAGVAKRSAGAGGALDAAQVVPAADDPVDGDARAGISLISFMDLECPYCAKFFPIARQFVAESGGSVNLRFRHFPIESHPNAMPLGIAAECVRKVAGDPAFFDMVARVYGSGRIDDVEAWLDRTLAAAKVDVEAVRACRASGEVRARLAALAARGNEAGVSATPTTVLFDSVSRRSQVIMGFQSLEQLRQKVAEFRAPPA